jgi:GT2 family glycosyltransferase
VNSSPAGTPAAGLLASVIISTYNRRDALLQTLDALGRQTVPPERYEVIVADDGSGDGTFEAASAIRLPCRLTVFRHDRNRGVSAGRNLAARHARGGYLILLSDDLIVPPAFVETHLATLDRFPGWWVVGGFTQLPDLTESPFGRYLDRLEREFEEARKAMPLGPNLWEMTWPTARNLSLPRRQFETIGGFDERFRTTCEDQDLAERARPLGVRYVYNDSITCLHNDQAGVLKRYCQFQRRGMRDTVLFCHLWADHADAPVARLNGYMSPADGPVLLARKLVKAVTAFGPVTRLLEAAVRVGERARLPDRFLWRLYRVLIGVYMFRGWREGLRLVRRAAPRTAPRPEPV